MLYRYEIINNIIKLNGFTKYLEIGVRDPADCFDRIKCKSKLSVDPAWESGKGKFKYDFELPSELFFWELDEGRLSLDKDHKWDVIFIDGAHISETVYSDAINALRHLSDDGFVVFHDCAPPTIYHAREDYKDWQTEAGAAWNGTTWKAIQRLRQECVDSEGKPFNLFTINTDWGVGVIKRGKWGKKFNPDYNPFYEYNTFRERAKEILNLREVEDYEKMDGFLTARNEDN